MCISSRLRQLSLLLLLGLPSLGQAQQPSSAAPQLGKARLSEILAALTPDEKVKLVLGMGFSIPGLPPGMLPPMDSADVHTPERVAGAGGRTHAVPRLGIPSLTLADGPAGIHINATRPGDSHTYYATAFPVATLLASSWNVELLHQVGQAYGREARAFGIDVLLAPGMNIQRNPLGGRNFEYYSEDPVVAGTVAAAFVRGVQSTGVGATVKHFAANNQEFNRVQLNSHISERALREIYLKGFQIAVQQAQPWTMMSSYNKINGTYTSESADLLTTLLRQEWHFRGLVMSDWFAGHSAPAQVAAGNDLLMPGSLPQRKELGAALRSARLTTAQLDTAVARVLHLVLQSPTFHRLPYTNQPDLTADAAVARRAATESMVLLRNQAHTLPLKAGRQIALFGNTSYDPIAGGTGSGEVNKAYSISLAQGLASAGFGLPAALRSQYERYIQAQKATQRPSQQLFAQLPVITELAIEPAVLAAQARSAAVAVVTLGRSAGEGGDRQEQDDFLLRADERTLVQQVSAAFHAQGKKVVVVLNTGGVLEVASWRDQADAILLAWQPGQEGGYAIADLLSGRANPSGKLAATFPMRYPDVPYARDFPGKVSPGAAPAANPVEGQAAENTYAEGIYVGYRYYTTFHVPPAYEFGYGLSYTTFAYSLLKLSTSTFTGQLTVSVTVTNTGTVAGKEVVQLYLSAPKGKLAKPLRELKAFGKTAQLAPGKSQTLTFTLTAADLASFDTAASAWVAEAGTYTVQVGASSLAMRQRATFQLSNEVTAAKSRPLLVPQAPIEELVTRQK